MKTIIRFPKISKLRLVLTICFLIVSLSFSTNAQKIELPDSLIKKLSTIPDSLKAKYVLDVAADVLYTSKTPMYLLLSGRKLATKTGNKYQFLRSKLLEGMLLRFIGKSNEASSVFKQTLLGFEKINSLKGLALTYFNIGSFFSESAQYDSALYNFNKAITYSENFDDYGYSASLYNNISIVYHELGDYNKQLDALLKGLKFIEQTNEYHNTAIITSNIGVVFAKLGNLDKAKTYFKKSAECYKKTGNMNDLSSIYHNLAAIHDLENDLDQCEKYVNLSLEIRKQIGAKRDIANSLINLGIICRKKKEYKKAMDCYIKSLNIFKELNDIRMIAKNYHLLGVLYSFQKENVKAIQYMNKGLLLADSIGNKDLVKEIYFGIADFYANNQLYKEAYDYYKRYSQTKDSIFNMEKSNQITEMETKYQSEKKQLEINNLEKEKALQKEEIARKEAEVVRQNTQKIAFAVGFGLMLLLAFVIYRGYRLKRKSNEIILDKNKELEKQKEIVYEKNMEITDSLRYAKRILNAILPPTKMIDQHLPENFVYYEPKDIVAGDFYWLESYEDKVFFTAADCTGHGVPGALVSVMCSSALSKAVKELQIYKPSDILNKTVEILEERFSKSEENVRDGMDLALCCLNRNEKSMEYAGANNPLYYIRNNQLYEIKADKQPIGKFENRKPFTNHLINLQKGDVIYIFSDGYPDQFGGENGKKYKYPRFKNLLLEIHDKPMNEQKYILENTLQIWRGALTQVDDICIFGVRIT